MTERILIIAAHPDDEVLGCGGTAARLAEEGSEVIVTIFGEGVTSRYQSPDAADRALVDRLHQHCREAGKMIGAQDVRLLGYPDNRFDTVALLELVKSVEQLIDAIRPSVVYTHHAGDLNIDHQLLARAVITATRPGPTQPVKHLYAFEIPSSTEWSFGQTGPAFHPNVFVDITDTLEAKIEAMQHYESEARPLPHPRSPWALRAIARRWGSVCGCQAAEAFQLIRSIRR